MRRGTAKEDFDDKFRLLREQIFAAEMSLDIWVRLNDRDKELAGALDRFRGFFVPTLLANQTLFFIKLGTATEARDRRQPSLFEILRLIEEKPALVPGLDVAELRTRLSELDDIIRRVHRARDRAFAHVDTNKGPPGVELREGRLLLEKLKGFFREISIAHGYAGDPFVINADQLQHTSELLELLRQEYNSPEDSD